MTVFADLAEPILRNAKILDQLKADLFDIFHDAPNADSLARKLQSVAISGNLKDQLLAAKRKSVGGGSNENLERAIDAIKRLEKMDPRVLELAEKNPTITAVLLDAVVRKA